MNEQIFSIWNLIIIVKHYTVSFSWLIRLSGGKVSSCSASEFGAAKGVGAYLFYVRWWNWCARYSLAADFWVYKILMNEQSKSLGNFVYEILISKTHWNLAIKTKNSKFVSRLVEPMQNWVVNVKHCHSKSVISFPHYVARCNGMNSNGSNV